MKGAIVQLSPHFSLAELTASGKADQLGIDNTPSPQIVENMHRLATLLEEVRDLVGAPVHVSSGYRCVLLNKAVGGETASAHLLGLAADIYVEGVPHKLLAQRIRDSGIEFDQLIYEIDWVHVGLSLGKPRHEVLTKPPVRGQRYLPGIV